MRVKKYIAIASVIFGGAIVMEIMTSSSENNRLENYPFTLAQNDYEDEDEGIDTEWNDEADEEDEGEPQNPVDERVEEETGNAAEKLNSWAEGIEDKIEGKE